MDVTKEAVLRQDPVDLSGGERKDPSQRRSALSLEAELPLPLPPLLPPAPYLPAGSRAASMSSGVPHSGVDAHVRSRALPVGAGEDSEALKVNLEALVLR